jgi:hypothetical protein
MIAFLSSSVLTIVAIGLLLVFEKQRSAKLLSFRVLLACMLLALSLWTILIIHIALLLDVHGVYGPVQFWYNSEHMPQVQLMYALRSVTIQRLYPLGYGLFWLNGLSLLWLTGASLRARQFPERTLNLVLPVLAMSCASIAGYCIVHYAFYPSA